MLKKVLSFLLMVIVIAGFSNDNEQNLTPTDVVKWKISIEQNGCEATVVATATIMEHWHLNAANLPEGSFSLPTEINLEKSSNYELIGGVIEPKPIVEYVESADEELSYHEGTVSFKRKIKILSAKDFVLKGSYYFQTCDDQKCLAPWEEEFTIKVKGCANEPVKNETNEGNNEEQNAVSKIDSTLKDKLKEENNTDEDISNNNTNEEQNSSVEVVEEGDEDLSKKSLWAIFFIAFFSGFAALLTPCVFPMIPMTVSFFTKQSKTKSAGIRNAIIYGLSIIFIYVVLGTVVTAIFGYDALNALSTNVWFNIIFFILLVVFAISFLGAFEITLPSSWVNKADQASDKGGLIGIFFMAFTLALVSFSCTGPIVGTLLVQSATIGGAGPFVGMLGFSLALALPFALFAAFPGWMNSLPKSGGWLNTVKVFLGFLELALAFKFLSNADLVVQAHLLEREVFLAIWIAVFFALALYLFGFIRFPHDSPLEYLSVGRGLLAMLTLTFVIYLLPGLWGAPLKLISGFPPPMSYSESPFGVGNSSGNSAVSELNMPEGTKIGPQGIPVFEDYDEGVAYAKKVGKPVFLDFTGHACVNCRKMEENVWGEPGIIDILKNEVVIISLHVDEKKALPEEEQIEVEFLPGKMKKLKTVGNKWSYLQASKYKTQTQPYYIMLGPNGEDLANGSADYEHHGNPNDFKKWLDEGLNLYKEAKKK